MGSFFYSRKVHFFVHLVNNLNYDGGSKHSTLRSASKTKRKKTRPEHRKHTKDPPSLSPHLFSALCDFFETFFGLHQRVPLHFFRYFATQWKSEKLKGSPFLHMTKSMCIAVQLSKFFFHYSQLHNERLLEKSQNPREIRTCSLPIARHKC